LFEEKCLTFSLVQIIPQKTPASEAKKRDSIINFFSFQESEAANPSNYNVLGSVTINLADFSRHNSKEVKIFSCASSVSASSSQNLTSSQTSISSSSSSQSAANPHQVGPTITVRITCDWITFNRKFLLSANVQDPRKTGESIAGELLHLDGKEYFLCNSK
jgi:hypothetical protein